MFYLVYKTTNNINGNIYIGIHRTNNINDGYIGSGLLFRKAISKYGKENFTREILHVCDSVDEMYEIESQLVNTEFVNRKDTYNIQVGGVGGAKDATATEYFRSGKHSANAKHAQQQALIAAQTNKQRRIDSYNEAPNLCMQCKSPLPYDKKHNKFCSKSCSASFNNTGRTVSDETKAKTSNSMIADKTIILRKKRSVARKEHQDKINSIKNQILSMNIDYAKRGWVTLVSETTGLPKNRIKQWMRTHMIDTYNVAYGS